MPAAVPRDKVKESDCVFKYNRSSCVVTFGRRLQCPSIKETCAALITRSAAEWWSVNQMLRIVSIKEFYPTSLLSSCLSLRQPDLFFCLSTFLLSAFFFLPLPHSSSRIHASLAKARPAQLRCLASPLRLEQRWTVPRWAHMQPAGSVPGWLWSCWWRWMDGWWVDDGHGLLACTLIFVC